MRASAKAKRRKFQEGGAVRRFDREEFNRTADELDADRLPVQVRTNGRPNHRETGRLEANNSYTDTVRAGNRTTGRASDTSDRVPDILRHSRRAANAAEGFKKGGHVKKFANGGITSDLSNRIAAARTRRTGVGSGVPARATPQNIRPVFSTPNFQRGVASGATADDIPGGIGRSGGWLGSVAPGTPAAPGTTTTPRTGGIMQPPAPPPPPTPPMDPLELRDSAGAQGNKKGGLIKSKSKNKRKSK